MSSPTTNLNTAPAVSALKSGKWITTEVFPLNSGTGEVQTPVRGTGIQSFSASPDGGNVVEVFQAGGAEGSYKVRDNQKYKGELTVLGGDLKIPYLLSGVKTGLPNATDGYALSASPEIGSYNHMVNKVCVVDSSTIQLYEIFPGIQPDATGIDWTITKKDETYKVPFMSYSIPFTVPGVDASGNALTPTYHLFTYVQAESSGNGFQLLYIPALLSATILPSQYNSKLIEVRKFTSTTDKTGTIVTDATVDINGLVTLGTALVAGELVGIFYVATTTAYIP